MRALSASAVTMSGASCKYLQHCTAWWCTTSQREELLTCLPNSMLYQLTSPSSDAATMVSLPSWDICRTFPVLVRLIVFSSAAFLPSLSSCKKITRSAAEYVSTLPGMHSIWDTSEVCQVKVLSTAPQSLLMALTSPLSAPIRRRRSGMSILTALMFWSVTLLCIVSSFPVIAHHKYTSLFTGVTISNFRRLKLMVCTGKSAVTRGSLARRSNKTSLRPETRIRSRPRGHMARASRDSTSPAFSARRSVAWKLCVTFRRRTSHTFTTPSTSTLTNS
mmetsp:Transcript_37827/g.98669  ORF Transcript_37827/g.98669 Transcript_37827/m.98669 type:complete len:276 (+) Transcript_37827:1306-2133(+)